jgi:hypothetical protein
MITTTSATWLKRLAAGTFLVAGSALMALGDSSYSTNPNVSSAGGHQLFPGQNNQPQPGTAIHHHHQWNR